MTPTNLYYYDSLHTWSDKAITLLLTFTFNVVGNAEIAGSRALHFSSIYTQRFLTWGESPQGEFGNLEREILMLHIKLAKIVIHVQLMAINNAVEDTVMRERS